MMQQGNPNNSRKKNKKWIWIIVVLLIAGIGFFLWSGAQQMKQSMKEEKVTIRDIQTYYSFSGNLAPVSDEVQTAKETMKIKEWYVQEGDVVQVDDILMRTSDGMLIYANYAGTVETIYPVVEDTLQPGAQIARIVDYTRLEVAIDVDEYDIEAVVIGKEGDVYINAFDKTVTGVVSEIARNATTEGGVSFFPVTLQIQGIDGVRSGMSVEVQMLNQQALGAKSLSLEAISYDEENKPYVLVAGKDNEMVAKSVQTGISDGAHIEILSGLDEDEVVSYKEDTMRFFMQPGMMTPNKMGKNHNAKMGSAR